MYKVWVNIYAQTSKKLTGHIGFGLYVCLPVCVSIRLSVHQEPYMIGFLDFIYGIIVEKYLMHFFS